LRLLRTWRAHHHILNAIEACFHCASLGDRCMVKLPRGVTRFLTKTRTRNMEEKVQAVPNKQAR